MVLTTQAGSMETMCLTTQEGQLGSNGLVKCLCAHVLALGPQQLPSWALLTPTSLPAPPFSSWDSFLLAFPTKLPTCRLLPS